MLPERVRRLQAAMQARLPGHDHFVELSGYQRPDIAQVKAMDPPPRESAVLAMLYPKNGELYTLLMLRPTYDGVHSAQVSFPGGKREPSDGTLERTALREFTEETGAAPDLTVLGPLSEVYIPPSRLLVTPFVAYTEELGALKPDPREVAALIETPLDTLLRDDILKRRELFIAVLGRTAEVPYFEVEGHVVWGATAMMIAELRQLLLGHGDPDLR